MRDADEYSQKSQIKNLKSPGTAGVPARMFKGMRPERARLALRPSPCPAHIGFVDAAREDARRAFALRGYGGLRPPGWNGAIGGSRSTATGVRGCQGDSSWRFHLQYQLPSIWVDELCCAQHNSSTQALANVQHRTVNVEHRS